MTKPLYSIQGEHEEWAEKKFGDQKASDLLLVLMEEVGELVHANRRRQWQLDHHAVGDVAIALMGYCTVQGVDLQSAIEDTWDKLKERDNAVSP